MFWLLFVSLIVACQAISENQVQEQWKVFLDKTQTKYKSVEAGYRLAIFRENLNKIDAHNELFEQGKVSYKMGVTKFTHLTSQEFLDYLGNNQTKQKRARTAAVGKFNNTLPESIDWREKGAVTNVKDQGKCNAGWSFSAAGSLEAQAIITKKESLDLSEQNLIDCAGAKYNNDGCNNGYVDGAFSYVSVHGIDSEKHYRYRKRKHLFCRQKQAVFKISSYKAVERTEEALQTAVAEIGPISAGVDVTHKLQNYVSGVFEDDSCSKETNHDILVVGYGYEKGKEYWILKNSWGSNWGEDGYFRLLRNAGACGIAEDAWYPII